VPLRGVIFDLDGTLIDSREADLEALARALEQLTGEPTRHDRLTRFFGVSSREAAEELVGAEAPALLELCRARITPTWERRFAFFLAWPMCCAACGWKDYAWVL
jgi:phosphoglycolate phosphatase-like HAD superfamily hydrolase